MTILEKVIKQFKKHAMPVALMLVFALSRIPGMMPQNFSAAYALVFCAGVFLGGSLAWWLPLVTMLVTDVALNFYYQSLGWNVWEWSALRYQLFNYAAYVGILWLGRRFRPKSSFLSLLGGGILGALLFYIVTNTASWLFNPFQNPEYTRTIWGWITALITGTKGWPETWTFLRNTLLSGGIFTGLFVVAMKLTAESPQEKEAGQRAPETEDEPAPDAQPEEAKA